ncbi:hypothetical protein IV203_026852 [Nitzschia inconspicua]|uniref:Uncharacterized protein n=1 Tax=Nitzschia inconspicua TaxID=303405 RepID=A0A9K3P9R0_9STRA|nr:hypothetical protein IV203_006797 [Nitzschia inconspicua]KAG7363491.1 hypothetical protein IV203_026852 [Nitzschia inconspicua]
MAEVPHEREEAAREGVEEVAAEAGLCILPSTLDSTPHVGNLLLREDLLASPPAHGDPTVSIPLTQEELAANQAAIRAINNQAGFGSPTLTNTAPTSDSSTGGMKKRKASPVTTARQQRKKTKAEERIKIGCRVKIQKKNLFHLLVTDQQKESLKGFNQNYNCYGTIKSGNAAAGYRVAFDNLPYEDKEVFVKRKKLTAVGSGNKETSYDKNTENPEVLETTQRENRSKKSTIQASIDEYAKTLDIQRTELVDGGLYCTFLGSILSLYGLQYLGIVSVFVIRCFLVATTNSRGQCTVDMHHCFRNRMIEKGVSPSKVDSIRILKFTDMMCGGLKQWPKPKQHFLIVGNEDGKEMDA